MREVETHPKPKGFIPENCKTLIIGTFPPKKEYLNNHHFFFYPSVRNHFWNRMENIFPEYRLKWTKNKCADLTTEQNLIDKEKFSTEKRIGFLDIFTRISRKNDESSKDIDLIPIENVVQNNKIFHILEQHPSITKICCTYKLAYEVLIESLEASTLKTRPNKLAANGKEELLNYKERSIEIYLLFPATRSREKKEIKDFQYKELIFN